MQKQNETAHSCKNAPLNTQKNRSENKAESNGVNPLSECQIKTPLERLPDWEAEADRIADEYTRTLAPRHLKAWRMHCGGVMWQLRAYGRHLSDALQSLKGGAA